jgi:hypothetical protein
MTTITTIAAIAAVMKYHTLLYGLLIGVGVNSYFTTK